MMIMKKKSKFQMTTMSIENTIICFIIGSIFPLQTTSTTTIKIAQLVGHNVSLSCPKRSSDDIKWIFNKDNEDTYFYEDETFKGEQFKDRCRFENDSATGKEILKISDIKPGDAGLYSCLTARDETPLQSTQLTVFDSEPTCDSNSKGNEFVGPNTCGLEQDYIYFSCAVSYHGTKVLRLQWETANGHQILNDSNCEEKANKTTKRINCTLTLKAESEYDKSVFHCKVMPSHGQQYGCSTKAIKVLYFTPEKHASELTPKHEEIGNTISCSANSSLKLNFIWLRKANNEERVEGRNRAYEIDKGGLYYCNVSYSIKDDNCSDKLSLVYVHPKVSKKVEIILIISLATPYSPFLLIVVCCIVHRRRKATSIQARISDAIQTKGWDTVKHQKLPPLKSGRALSESDYNKILGEEDGKKGIHMLVATLCSGGKEACNIFKSVVNDILKIDLANARCDCGKHWYPHDFGEKTKASKASGTDEAHELCKPLSA